MCKKCLICCVLLITVLTTKSFAKEKNNTFIDDSKSKIELTKIIFADEIEYEIEEKTYHDFISNSIPSKFVNPFYEYTKNNKNIGIELLGIAKHESNWKVFDGPKNENGTRDHGPMMLNSGNLADEKFMLAFGSDCTNYKYDRDIYYMCICINFYRDLRKQYGPWVALQIYNGGWRTVRKSCPARLKRTVTEYANKVYSYINSYESEYKTFKLDSREKIENYVAIQYSTKLNNYIRTQYIATKIDSLKRTRIGLGITLYPRIWKELLCTFDEEYFELYILQKWCTQNIILFTKEELEDLDDEEEYFEIPMLC